MPILVVTNSDDPTADYVLERGKESGCEMFRFNTDLTIREMSHSFRLDCSSVEILVTEEGKSIPITEVSGIWYRRPVDPEPLDELSSDQAREYAVDEAYYYLRCLWKLLEDRIWVSHPWAISWASVKLHQLLRARSLGFQAPRTLATNDPAEARTFWESLEGEVVVKPFESNVIEYGNRTPVIYTTRVTEKDLERLQTVKYTITLLQEEIDKEIELRVTVIGDDLFCAAIDSQANPDTELDWRRTSSVHTKWQNYSLPEHVAELCVELVHSYGLSFGAVDLAVTPAGDYVFFELNPNGQWVWLEIELGLPMTRSLLGFLGT